MDVFLAVQISEYEQEKEKEEEEVKVENTREVFNGEADHNTVSGVAYLPSFRSSIDSIIALPPLTPVSKW